MWIIHVCMHTHMHIHMILASVPVALIYHLSDRQIFIYYLMVWQFLFLIKSILTRICMNLSGRVHFLTHIVQYICYPVF